MSVHIERKPARAVRGHSQRGAYMVELILAIATAGMLAAALASNIAETERFSNAGQNQILAMSIVQEQIDNARNTSFDDLSSWAGTHTLKVNNPDPNYNGCPVASCVGGCKLNPRPLQLDLANLEWTAMEISTSNKKQNVFQGTVSEQIIPSGQTGGPPYANTVKVIVEAVWREGQATRRYRLETLVSKNGINNG
ncbi:MAG TPA: type II secretion system protein [Candidatus Obscuribacterales bacterium]